MTPDNPNTCKPGSDKTPAKPSCDENKWSASEVKDGKGEIKLGKDYTLNFDESKQEFILKNNCSGDVTKVFGDPHVDQGNDGKNDWDFKKDTTFQLKDGTKITVDTVDGSGKQVDKATTGPSYASKLTITKGDKAMVVSGLAGYIDGNNNVKVTTSGNGRQIDRATDDGTVVHETKGGWTRDGKAVDQKAINDAEAKAVC